MSNKNQGIVANNFQDKSVRSLSKMEELNKYMEKQTVENGFRTANVDRAAHVATIFGFSCSGIYEIAKQPTKM